MHKICLVYIGTQTAIFVLVIRSEIFQFNLRARIDVDIFRMSAEIQKMHVNDFDECIYDERLQFNYFLDDINVEADGRFGRRRL